MLSFDGDLAMIVANIKYLNLSVHVVKQSDDGTWEQVEELTHLTAIIDVIAEGDTTAVQTQNIDNGTYEIILFKNSYTMQQVEALQDLLKIISSFNVPVVITLNDDYLV